MLTDKAIKDELHSLVETEGVTDAYVSALLTFGGELGRDEKGYYLYYATHDYLLALELARYIKEGYSYAVEVGMSQPKDKRRNKFFTVEVHGRQATEMLSALGKVTVTLGKISAVDNGVKSKISSAKEAAEYARGVYLSVGSASRASGGLRVALAFDLADYRDAFSEFLTRHGVEMNRSEKDGKFYLNSRKGQVISDFFALIGASKSALAVLDKVVKSEAKSKIQRASQLNVANLDKAMVAAIKQYNDVLLIKEKTSFYGLPPELKTVAEARLQNAEASLDVLREILPEKISKSGLYHRFEKLAEIAGSLREKKE